MIVTVFATATMVVAILNAGETLCPSGTTTDTGGTTAGSLLLSCTVAPPAGATPASDTVLPPAVTLPTTELSATFNADSGGAGTIAVTSG